ncbi:MAG: DUF2508 family protein [Gorillibacterium sp.]|nr:DUF2508 family protein [Gorillibacterium sp.]
MRTWFKDNRPTHGLSDEHYQLIKEIRLAREQWINAQNHLDWVGSMEEEVDYVIYALTTAEKKYDVLLKRAKQLDWTNISYYIS